MTGPAAVSLAPPVTDFRLPPQREAHEPPERRGLTRDGVRLLVARPTGIRHDRFTGLPHHLSPGDVVVVNTSATLPAALDAERDAGGAAVVHVGTGLDDGAWVVEVRRGDARGPRRDVTPGEVLRVAGDLALTITGSYPVPGVTGARMWRAVPHPAADPVAHLSRHGRPVAYGHAETGLPLADHQTLFAREPGSAEMPSAARPFTPRILVDLLALGVVVAPVVLHAGLSSAEAGEPPVPERFAVPATTAELVDRARDAGRRVVAVGTTVARALESAADPDGRVRGAAGWTDLVVDRRTPVRVVTGLVTGWHSPRASHLALLEAVAGPGLVRAAYDAALAGDYLWHEFGDSCLLLP